MKPNVVFQTLPIPLFQHDQVDWRISSDFLLVGLQKNVESIHQVLMDRQALVRSDRHPVDRQAIVLRFWVVIIFKKFCQWKFWQKFLVIWRSVNFVSSQKLVQDFEKLKNNQTYGRSFIKTFMVFRNLSSSILKKDLSGTFETFSAKKFKLNL